MTKTKKPVVTFWRVVGVLGALLLLVIGWAVWFVATSASARPTVSVDYATEIVELSRSYQMGVETERNRHGEIVDLLTRAGAIREEFDADISVFDKAPPTERERRSDAFLGEPTYEERIDAANAYLVALEERGVFDELRELSGARHVVRDLPAGSLVAATAMNTVGVFRFGDAQTLCLASLEMAERAAEKGETHRAIELIEGAYACGRLISCEPFLISGLVANSIELMAHSRVHALVLDGAFDDGELAELLRIMDSQRPLPYEFALRSEEMILLDIIQRTYTDDGSGGGYLLLGRVPSVMNQMGGVPAGPTMSNPFLNAIGRLTGDRRALTDSITGIYDEASMVASDPLHPVASLRALEDRMDGEWEDHLLLGILMPAVSRAAENAGLGLLGRRATEAVIALERYRLAEGAYPSSLDAVGEWEGVRYRVEDGRRSYTLYSVGKDGVDDGGDAELDRVYVPVAE